MFWCKVFISLWFKEDFWFKEVLCCSQKLIIQKKMEKKIMICFSEHFLENFLDLFFSFSHLYFLFKYIDWCLKKFVWRKEYFPNLLEIWFLGQIFVYCARCFKFWLLAYFLILLNCAKSEKDWTTFILHILQGSPFESSF